jgi:predicted nucleic acid-binding protein
MEMKCRIYLDNCCFNRPFDDQNQIRIRLETTAKLYIQRKIRQGVYELVWSYMLDFENYDNPYEDKRNAIQIWEYLARHICKSSADVLLTAKDVEKFGIASKDALHISCALKSECDYFITTDKKLLNKIIEGIKIVNPVDFIREMED